MTTGPVHPDPDLANALDHWEAAGAPEPACAEPAASPERLAPPEQDDAAEARCAAARETGYAEGYAAARAEFEAAARSFSELAHSLAAELDTLEFRLADQVRDLALDVARQVVLAELTRHPERVLGVVKEALHLMVETTRESRLMLNPEDAALVRAHFEGVLDKTRLRIVEDARIARGGCLIETPQGDIDATLPARWRQVVQVLGSSANWTD